jgi:hypothetical protein
MLTGAALVVGCATGVTDNLEPLPESGGSNGTGGGQSGSGNPSGGISGSGNPSGGSGVGGSVGGAPTGGASGSSGGAVFGGSAGVPNGGSAGASAGSGGQLGGSGGQGGSAGKGGSFGQGGSGGKGGSGGTGGVFGGDCEGMPTMDQWKAMGGHMTGDQVVFVCTPPLQSGCQGLVDGTAYLWECTETHVPNCESQDPRGGMSWTLLGPCD